MVIVHLSDNQRRVIATEKGETIHQLCQRFCREYGYQSSEFELYGVSTNEPLPLSLSVTEIKEVRLVRKDWIRKGSDDSCYSSIDEKSLTSSLSRRVAPLPLAPTAPLPTPSSQAHVNRIVKRLAPPPPPSYKVYEDVSVDEADIYLPSPPSESTSYTGTYSPLFVSASVECTSDRVPSPRICLAGSNNSSSIDSSEEGSITAIGDFVTITSPDRIDQPRLSNHCVTALTNDERCKELQEKDTKQVIDDEVTVTPLPSDEVSVLERIYVPPSLKDKKKIQEIVTVSSVDDGLVLRKIEDNHPVQSHVEESVDVTDGRDAVASVTVSTNIEPVVTTAVAPVTVSTNMEPVVTTTVAPGTVCTNMQPVVTTAVAPVTVSTNMEPVVTTTVTPGTVSTNMQPVITAAVAPVTVSTNMEPVVTTAVPMATKRRFWEPVKTTKQLIFTSRKSMIDEVKPQPHTSAAASTILATDNVLPGQSSKPVNVIVKEQVPEKSGRPEYIPARAKSMYFSAGNK